MSSNYPFRDSNTFFGNSSPFKRNMDYRNRLTINPGEGGQYAWAPNIYEFVSEHPHIQQQAYCNLMSSPVAYNKLPNGIGPTMHMLAKCFFENRTKIFEGLTTTTQNEFADQKFGSGGQMLSVPTGSSRQLGNVTHHAIDPEGETFYHWIKTTNDYLVSEPQIQHPLLVTVPDPGDMALDDISFSLCYWEPTRNMRDIAHAAVVVGAFIKQTPQIDLKRDLETPGQMRELQVELTGLVDFDSYAAITIARTFLSRMPLYNPNGRDVVPGFNQPTADVQNVTSTGLIERMQQENAKIRDPNYMR